MGIGSVLKRAIGGARSVVRGVGDELGEALQPSPAAPPPREAGPADLGLDVPNFQLPTLDPSDPDFAEKKAIHDAYEELGKMHQQYAQRAGEGYKTYYNDLAEHVRGRAAGKKFSPLSAFAIGLGNPEALNKVAATNEKAEQTDAQKEADLYNLREQALRGHISQLMEEGKFAQALKQSAMLADVTATSGRIKREAEHKNKMEEINTTQNAITERTRATNQRMIEVANRRALSAARLANMLDPVSKSKMTARSAAALSEFQQAIKGDPLTGIDKTPEEKQAAWDAYIDKTDDITDEAYGMLKKEGFTPVPGKAATGADTSGVNLDAEAAAPATPEEVAADQVPPKMTTAAGAKGGVKMRKGNVTRMVSADKVAKAKALGYSEVK